MMPTPHAVALVQPLRQALELLRVATQQQVVFDPSSSSRHFHIAMTDISHLEFLLSLINKMSKLAPDVRVDVLRITSDTPRLLESGDADLAVGFMPELRPASTRRNCLTRHSPASSGAITLASGNA